MNFLLILWNLIQIVLVLNCFIFKFWFVTKCFYLSSYYGFSSCFVPILSSHTMICGCKIYDDFCKMSFCRWHNLEQLSGQHFLTFFTQEKFVLEQQLQIINVDWKYFTIVKILSNKFIVILDLVFLDETLIPISAFIWSFSNHRKCRFVDIKRQNCLRRDNELVSDVSCVQRKCILEVFSTLQTRN